jgi:hypothetical protein
MVLHQTERLGLISAEVAAEAKRSDDSDRRKPLGDDAPPDRYRQRPGPLTAPRAGTPLFPAGYHRERAAAEGPAQTGAYTRADCVCFRSGSTVGIRMKVKPDPTTGSPNRTLRPT